MQKNEQRRAPHIRAKMPVAFESGVGFTRDISTSGILFETNRSFSPGDSIEFTILPEHDASRNIGSSYRKLYFKTVCVIGKLTHQLSQSEIWEPYFTIRITKDGSVVEVSIISTALVNESGGMHAIATAERAK